MSQLLIRQADTLLYARYIKVPFRVSRGHYLPLFVSKLATKHTKIHFHVFRYLGLGCSARQKSR